MKQIIVQYRTLAGKTAENERLVREVFRELAEKTPGGLRYTVLKSGEDRFTHIALYEETDGTTPLRKLATFQAFQNGASQRFAEPPSFSDMEILGQYGMMEAR